MKTFVDAVESFITEMYINQELDSTDLYDPLWRLGTSFWDIAVTCNFQPYLRVFVFDTYKLNNIHNNLVQNTPRIMKYMLILAYGMIFDSKTDVGEAIGTFFACTTGLYRTP